MSFLSRAASFLVKISEKLIPSTFVIALLLILFTFAIALGVAKTSFADSIKFWGNGFWELLPFAMQMSLIILTGYIVAS
jgi:short-chain fatty acids transporter